MATVFAAAEDKFLATLLDDIRNNRLTLPTLPEIALKVRNMVDDPHTSSGQIAKVITSDPALSARLIQVANSAMLRGRAPVDNVQMAVARMGNTLVRNLVTGLLVQQLYQARSPVTRKLLKDVWRHSTQVAAISYALAAHCTNLKPDEALLAGLVHDIGALPILTRAEKYPELLQNESALLDVVRRMHCEVGKTILMAWDFTPELITAVAEHETLQRSHGQAADYADVVLAANLQSRIGTDHPHNRLDWNTVPAFAKLGIGAEVSVISMEDTAEQVEEMQRLLAG
jgi:putative nucleotidyltransferase with HDIG domain